MTRHDKQDEPHSNTSAVAELPREEQPQGYRYGTHQSVSQCAAQPRPATHPAAHRKPLLFAHRGSTLLAPENTSYAFDLALGYQADVLETDVRLSRDGHVIVTHDARIDRTTDGQGAVCDISLAKLKKLDAGYRFISSDGKTYRHRGMRLLTLDDLFARYPNTRINIDIKDRGPAAARAVAEVVHRYPAAPWVNVGSFHAPTLYYFRQFAPEVSTAAVHREVAQLYFGRFVRRSKHSLEPSPLRYQYAQIPEFYRGIPLAGNRFIKSCRNRNVNVVYWTINHPSRMRTLLERGANGIVTDRPDLALTVFQALGVKPIAP